MIKTGEQIAGYRIDSVIGAGGMGVVYEATQLALDRSVALKVLTPGLGADPVFRERFHREAKLQAALEHPGIVSVYEAGESDEGLFIAMRLVRGSDLRELVDTGLEPARAIDLLAQAAEALDAAHAAGLVHRDVKPQNILVDGAGRAFLADFGLTKDGAARGMTLTGQFAGSLDYAAPEQIRGEPYGASADLYAFGVVLFEALTGRVPYPYDTEAALLFAHLSEQPPRPTEIRPELPAGLDEVLARALSKQPHERYPSATALVDDARRALASQPLAEPNGRRRLGQTIVDGAMLRTPPVIAVGPERRVPWGTVALVAVVLVALAVGGLALGRATHASPSRRVGIASAGPLSLTFPSGDWRPAVAPSIPGLGLVSTVALTSTDPNRPGTLVAGIASAAQGASLLPPALRAQLTGAAPAHTVRLGELTAVDYPSLPAGKVPWRMSLLLVPTARGAAAVACLVPRVLAAGQAPADCDPVAATLSLSGLQALPLGQDGAYARSVGAALTLLDGEQLAGRRQLAGATTHTEEARAAALLRTAFASTATRLAHVAPTPFARPAHAALVAALRREAASYGALAAAARAQDAHAFQRAAKAVDAADRAVAAAVTRLNSIRLP